MVLCFMYKPRSAYKLSQTLIMETQRHYYDRVPTRTTKNGSSKKEVDQDVIWDIAEYENSPLLVSS